MIISKWLVALMDYMYESNPIISQSPVLVGVGLWHQNYKDILRLLSQTFSEWGIDFVEVHAEIFW